MSKREGVLWDAMRAASELLDINREGMQGEKAFNADVTPVIDLAKAIVDDIAQFSAEQQTHFVQTSYVHGLREKDLRKIEAILELSNEDSEPAKRSA